MKVTFVKAIGGRKLLMLEVVVDMARRVVMTMARADLWSNQKDIQETQTVMKDGT